MSQGGLLIKKWRLLFHWSYLLQCTDLAQTLLQKAKLKLNKIKKFINKRGGGVEFSELVHLGYTNLKHSDTVLDLIYFNNTVSHSYVILFQFCLSTEQRELSCIWLQNISTPGLNLYSFFFFSQNHPFKWHKAPQSSFFSPVDKDNGYLKKCWEIIFCSAL